MTRKRLPNPHWILASASPRRNEILSSLGLKFRVDPSLICEPPQLRGEKSWNYVSRIARLKAREVSSRHRSGLVIGADTIVVAGDRIMGKPSSAAEARSMLSILSAAWHEVVTAVCLFDCGSGRFRSAYARSRVHFRRISPAEIEWYIRTGEYRDKAGAYAIQGCASLFIDRIEGCYFNIVGFPIETFERLCRSLGVHLRLHLNPRD
ncbi:MAG TPA: nucleoside triphosphate pyrophosphatase [Acidobacteriota bacterium]|nr:nucleoside triphosphate pyrophosphatase [Acidobacteriota bacterium]